MIIWNITNEEYDNQIEVGQITIFKGTNEYWYKLVRLIEDFFTNKNTTVEIYEDTHILHKKDWECLFIPYDAHLQIDKLNAKSPLKLLLDEVTDELSFSPVFHELNDIWDELGDELSLINHKVEKYGLSLNIDSFNLDILKGSISFQSLSKMMTPIEYKKLLLYLFADKNIEKKVLIILELPELFASDVQLNEFINYVYDLSEKGINFIIVTNKQLQGSYNYIIRDKIINQARIDNIKRKIINEVPFACDDELFEEAKRTLLHTVDNYTFKDEKYNLSTLSNEAILVLLFVMGKHLQIEINIDITGISSNLDSFIKSYYH